jgi:hypothetical protein
MFSINFALDIMNVVKLMWLRYIFEHLYLGGMTRLIIKEGHSKDTF